MNFSKNQVWCEFVIFVLNIEKILCFHWLPFIFISVVQLIVLFFVAAASAAAIDDAAEKKQDKRGVLGVGYGAYGGYGGYGGLGYGGIHSAAIAAPIAPLGAYHGAIAAPAIGMLWNSWFAEMFI